MSAPPIFATLGCRLNAYESEAMAEMARELTLLSDAYRDGSRQDAICEPAPQRVA